MSDRLDDASRAEATGILEPLTANMSRLLIALDFDGTIAPIVPDPPQARLAPGAAAALAALVAHGAQVVLISGRDAATVVALSGLRELPDLVVEGLYGAERWRAGTLTTLPTPSQMTVARAELGRLIPARSQLWVEDKRLSLVVHGRRAPDPAAALAGVADAVRRVAGSFGLEVHPGRQVLELRLPGFDKGAALRRAVRDSGRSRVLFAGDDVGDLPAFDALVELRRAGVRTCGIVVRSSEVRALDGYGDLVVDGPGGLVELLTHLGRHAEAGA